MDMAVVLFFLENKSKRPAYNLKNDVMELG